jgi:hypothetical protein
LIIGVEFAQKEREQEALRMLARLIARRMLAERLATDATVGHTMVPAENGTWRQA